MTTDRTQLVERTVEVYLGASACETFRFTLRSNGTGLVRRARRESFEFTFHPEEIDIDLDDEDLSAAARELFEARLEGRLREPLITTSTPLGGNDTRFVSGSPAELERMTRTALQAFDIWDSVPSIGVRYASTFHDNAVLGILPSDPITTPLTEILEMIGFENEFSGFTGFFDDDRYHTLTVSAVTRLISVPRPSAHEALAARRDLVEFLCLRVPSAEMARLLA